MLVERNFKQRSWSWSACFWKASSPFLSSTPTNTSLQNIITLLITVVDYSVIDYPPTLLVRSMTTLSQRVLQLGPQSSCTVWRLSAFMQVIFHYSSAKSCGVNELEKHHPTFLPKGWESFWPGDRATPRLPDPLQRALWDVRDGWLRAVTLTCCCQHNPAAANLSRLSPPVLKEASVTRDVGRATWAAWVAEARTLVREGSAEESRCF